MKIECYETSERHSLLSIKTDKATYQSLDGRDWFKQNDDLSVTFAGWFLNRKLRKLWENHSVTP